jgi:hypothetical protein
LRIFSKVLAIQSAKNGSSWLSKKSEIKDCLKEYFKTIYASYNKKSPAELRNLRSERVGESGFTETEDEKRSIIQFEYDPDFPSRGSLSPFLVSTHEFAYSMNQINVKGLASGKIKEWVFPTFDYLTFKRRFQKTEFNQDSFAGIINELHKAIVEGSGGKKAEQGNRLAKLLELNNIVDNSTIQMLDHLRNYYDHDHRALTPEKRQSAISILKNLTGKNDLADSSELSTKDFEVAAKKVVVALKDDVLKVARSKIGL